jgi:hypothetical protein
VEKVLDKNHRGVLSENEVADDPIFRDLVGGNLTHLLHFQTNVTGNQNKATSAEPQTAHSTTNQDTISVENELKPALLAAHENVTSPSASTLSVKCLDVQYIYFEWIGGFEGCPVWMKSHSNLETALSMIGNVSSDIGTLILQGENDTATPVEQGLLLQQRLTEVKHPDHLLITYPNLGHSLSPSSEWVAQSGPIAESVMEDMFEWLASPTTREK